MCDILDLGVVMIRYEMEAGMGVILWTLSLQWGQGHGCRQESWLAAAQSWLENGWWVWWAMNYEMDARGHPPNSVLSFLGYLFPCLLAEVSQSAFFLYSHPPFDQEGGKNLGEVGTELQFESSLCL